VAAITLAITKTWEVLITSTLASDKSWEVKLLMGIIKQQALAGDARACWVIFYQIVRHEIDFSSHKYLF
jgi:hypothetical protein